MGELHVVGTACGRDEPDPEDLLVFVDHNPTPHQLLLTDGVFLLNPRTQGVRPTGCTLEVKRPSPSVESFDEVSSAPSWARVYTGRLLEAVAPGVEQTESSFRIGTISAGTLSHR